jgi:glycosyltransferase involved in cell wall biosynthesis
MGDYVSAASSLVGAARSAYRRLPLPLRQRISPGFTPFWTLFRAGVAAHAPNADPSLRQPANAAVVVGLFRTASGLGAGARLLSLELARGGIAVRGIDVSAEHDLPIELPADSVPDGRPREGEAVILHLNPPGLRTVLPWLQRSLMCDRRLIGYWTWELARAPPDWERAARLLHEIWTPSRFAADAIARTAPGVIVRVAPHPVVLGARACLPPDRLRARLWLGAAPHDFVAFTTFAMSSCMARKNPLGAIAAFDQAFSGRRDALLVVRMREANRYPRGALQVVEAASRSRARIRILQGKAGEPDLQELYSACDAYLSLHRSEGFGLTIAEAMLMGRPVVATAWSGNLEFTPTRHEGLVPAKLTRVSDPQGLYTDHRCRWADPDLDTAAEKLMLLAADPDAREAWSAQARDYARIHLVGGAAADALRMVAETPPPRRSATAAESA